MTESKTNPNLTLVVGVDGSGKSTFLNKLNTTAGYEVVEPTSTDEARQFKENTLDTPLDDELIDRREQLYVALNSHFDLEIQARVEAGEKIATSGGVLVTIVSHALMREVINSPKAHSATEATKRWADDPTTLKPGVISLVYAPNETIMQRILGRQSRGDISEKFWGFNSPLFLIRYQEAWQRVINTLVEESDIICMTLDTSAMRPDEMVDEYRRITSLSTKEAEPSYEKKSTVDELVQRALGIIDARYGPTGSVPKPYHSLQHTHDVIEATSLLLDALSSKRRVTDNERHLALVAAAYHDVQQDLGSGRNEEVSADIAVAHMQESGFFSEADQARVRAAIMATQLSFDGTNIKQSATDDYVTEVLADADLAALGQPTDIYWDRLSKLFLELHPEAKLTDEPFRRFLSANLLVFLRNHDYYTEEARQLFTHKADNIAYLESMVR